MVILGRHGAYILWEEEICDALRNCAEGKAQPRVDMAIRTNNGVGPAERQENLCSTELCSMVQCAIVISFGLE